MPEASKYSGGCHCGRVRYEVTAKLDPVISCNCSMCQKRGALWAIADPAQFTLLSGGEDLADYQFNKKIIHHLFCRHCGIGSFARGKHPDGSDAMTINVRCLDDIDLASLTLTPFDGRSL